MAANQMKLRSGRFPAVVLPVNAACGRFSHCADSGQYLLKIRAFTPLLVQPYPPSIPGLRRALVIINESIISPPFKQIPI